MALEKAGTFWDHLGSLRHHVLAAFAVVVTSAVAFLSYASSPATEYLLDPLLGTPLVFLTPMGPFLFKLKISLYLSLAFSFPVLFLIFFHFVAPALNRSQRIAATLFALLSLVFAFGAVALAYFYLIPYTLSFLLSLTVPGTSLMLTAESYLNFFILESLVAFVLLQLPLVLVALAYLKILNPQILLSHRRYLYVSLLLALAVLTPTTDAFTLVIVYLPALFLAEIGLAIGKLVYDNKDQENHG